MRLWNCKDPDISLKLLPWYVAGDKYELDIGWELHERLKENPDDTFCCIAIENNRIQAFVVAYCRQKNVFIWQAKARSGFNYSQTIFNGLVLWARGKGRKKLKANSSRRSRAIKREWGFTDSKNNEIERRI